MKKHILLLIAFAAAPLLFSCTPHDDPDEPADQPTEAEKNMITEPSAWTLDSVLVITYYNEPAEHRELYTRDDGILTWTYRLYPSSYRFPADLLFTSDFDGSEIRMSEEYRQDYCKYTCESGGRIISAGYLIYYRDFFTFSGMKTGGWMEFRIVETAAPSPAADVWTMAYDASADDDHVYERRVEYYSRLN